MLPANTACVKTYVDSLCVFGCEVLFHWRSACNHSLTPLMSTLCASTAQTVALKRTRQQATNAMQCLSLSMSLMHSIS
eukprot:6918-Heterococcus_DN1.PRE.6